MLRHEQGLSTDEGDEGVDDDPDDDGPKPKRNPKIKYM